ncbi:unnamed protein product [marine sediment metagenome]|uniref:Uncharacterized protein n=1 Tax=marine sediment metagenome TaxID=412755 RepID=X1DQW7_9ZZZZ
MPYKCFYPCISACDGIMQQEKEKEELNAYKLKIVKKYMSMLVE